MGRAVRFARADARRPKWQCSSPAREAEHALGDDVALDLRRPRVDGLGLGPHPAVLPAAVLDGVGRVWAERAVRAFHADRGLLDALVHLAPVELGETRLRTWRVPVLCLRQVAQADEPENVGLDLRLRDLLAHADVRSHPSLASQRGELLYCPLESSRLGQTAALEALAVIAEHLVLKSDA